MNPKPDEDRPEGLTETATLDAATVAIRTGHERTAIGEHSEPVFTTSSFVFGSAAEAAARFSGDSPGYIYSRFTNPTVNAFQTRLAALEGGERCVATASGMSAIMTLCLSVLKQGDEILASKSMFGSTVGLFGNLLPRFGITTRWVASNQVQDWAAGLNGATKMIFLETPTNPLVELSDIRAVAELAEANDVLLVVDNCFCSPVLQQPLKLGADIVIHSATKYIDGQGRCVGGAIVGPASILDDAVYSYMRNAGASLSPFNAWVFLKGLETLSLRMDRHCHNAGTIANWLNTHAAVETVNYPGLSDHPQHTLAGEQQSGYGGVLSFEVKGGKPAAWALIDGVKLMSITANLGDAKTTITHPATTTHGRMSEADRLEIGVRDGLIRIAAGLESADDLINDLDQSLSKL